VRSIVLTILAYRFSWFFSRSRSCCSVANYRSRRIENGPDFRKRNIELPMDQDLLQPQQFLVTVATVAIVASECGL
jgi:hypothetical protein